MRKILIGLAGLILVVIVGLAVYISQIDVTEYKDQALAEVEKATGRKVSIDGDLDIALSLTPSIVVEGIRISNADWASTPDMLTIKRIEVQVGLLPLLSNEIDIKRFILVEPGLFLEKNKNGKGNWEIGESSAEKESAEGPHHRMLGVFLEDDLAVVLEALAIGGRCEERRPVALLELERFAKVVGVGDEDPARAAELGHLLELVDLERHRVDEEPAVRVRPEEAVEVDGAVGLVARPGVQTGETSLLHVVFRSVP